MIKMMTYLTKCIEKVAHQINDRDRNDVLVKKKCRSVLHFFSNLSDLLNSIVEKHDKLVKIKHIGRNFSGKNLIQFHNSLIVDQ